jgi:cbb3-type cytochrome oxidase subunit 3
MELERRRPILLASVALAVLATAYTTLKPPRSSDSARETVIEVLIVLAVALATLLVTRRQITSDDASKPSGRVALGVAVAGLLSIGVFWLGVFSIAIAGGAILIAMEARRRGNAPRAATAALAVSAVTVGLSILVAVAS